MKSEPKTGKTKLPCHAMEKKILNYSVKITRPRKTIKQQLRRSSLVFWQQVIRKNSVAILQDLLVVHAW